MVYRILSILTHIAFGVMTLAFIVCFAYTLAKPVVTQSIDQARDSMEQVATSAVDAMEQQLQDQTDVSAAQLQSLFAPIIDAVSGVVANFTAADGSTSANGAATEEVTYSGVES
jgi:cellobiose-specific phosphotransferase system component IIC